MSEAVATQQQGQAGKYRPYPEYKDSGVEWLGIIPTHWSLHALKRTVSGCSNGIWGDEPNGESDLIVLRVADFDRNKLTISDDKLTYRSISERERKTRLLKKGDLLIEKSGGGEKTLVGCVVLFDKEYSAVTSNFVAKMSPREAFCSNFLSYAFSHLYAGRVNYPSIKQTTGIQNLDSDSYLMEHFCFPDSSDQQTIAAFLDYETARIDRLIAQQQRLIELLKEKRQAVISHAVTKGLNPDAPMKDSGVEWIGQVPEHWVMSPLKYKCVFSGGGTPSKDNLEYWNGSIPWVSPKDMKSFWITDAEDKITEQAIKESSTKLVQPGAVLMVVRSGILQRTIPVGMNTIPVTMNQDMKAIRFSSAVYAEWLSFFIKGYEDSLLLDWRKQGATVESIEHEYLANSLMLFPPEEEARSIIAALGRRLDKFDQLEQRASDAITLLQERRTALISAAVTGKIDLRGWTQPAEEVAA